MVDQEIALSIPAERKLHEWWSKCTPVETADALDIAGSMLTLMKGTLRNEPARPLTTRRVAGEEAPAEYIHAVADVISLLAQTLPCEIIEQRAGRFFLTTAVAERRVLVAIRNDASLRSKTDIDGFFRDIFTEEEEVDGALFVSLKARLPNVTETCQVKRVETRTSRAVPTVLLASCSRAALQLAVCCLFEIMDGTRVAKPTEQLEKEHEALKRTLPKLCQQLDADQARVEVRVGMLQSLLDEARAEQHEHRQTAYALHQMRSAVRWLAVPVQDETANLDAAIEVYKHLSKDGAPRTSRMTLTQRETIKNAGGMRTVAAAVARRGSHQNGVDGKVGTTVEDATPVV